jgi:hypothetical protein|nr:MAG TPA: hypothetical protein [Caudoviricetes sp.]
MSTSITVLTFGVLPEKDDQLTTDYILSFNKNKRNHLRNQVAYEQDTMAIISHIDTHGDQDRTGILLAKDPNKKYKSDLWEYREELGISWGFENLQHVTVADMQANRSILDKFRSPTYLESIAHISFVEPIHSTTMGSITPFIKTYEFATMPNIVYNNSVFNPALIMFIVKELDLEEFDVTFDFTSGIYSNFTNFYKGRLQIVYQPHKKGFLIGVDFQVDPDYEGDETFQEDIKRLVNCDYENLTMIEMEYNLDYFISFKDLETLLVEKNHHMAFLQQMIDKCNRYVKEQWADLQTITADDDKDDGDFVY